MGTDNYELITGQKKITYYDIDHIIINYVDDSTNITSGYYIQILQKYIDQYYILLTNYYNINYLKINSDKSTLLVTTKLHNRQLSNDLKLTAGDYIIQKSDKIKILGLYFTNGLDNTPNINKLIQKINYHIGVLNKITKYTNLNTSLVLYNSLTMSVLNYCIETIINNTAKQKSNLNTLLNKCVHRILGFSSYKCLSSNNLAKLNWVSYQQLLIMGSGKLIHRIIYDHRPRALTNIFPKV